MSRSLTATEAIPPGRSQPPVEDLIRQLVGASEGWSEIHSSSDADSEEILLDVDVDGARYLLVRLPSMDRPAVQLSPREQEIVRMVAQGHPNKVIAQVLSISTYTVCTHLRRVFAKVGVGSRAAMVARLFDKRNAMPDKSAQNPARPLEKRAVSVASR